MGVPRGEGDAVRAATAIRKSAPIAKWIERAIRNRIGRSIAEFEIPSGAPFAGLCGDEELLEQLNTESKRRALIVEPAVFCRRLLSAVLAGDGFVVDEVDSAESALCALGAHVYDIVLLGIVLADARASIDLLDAIRRRVELDPVPVILITTHATDTETIAQGLLAGADDYVPTPIQPAVLRARVAAAEKGRALALRRRAESSPPVIIALDDGADEKADASSNAALPCRFGSVWVTGHVPVERSGVFDALDIVTDERGRTSICLLECTGRLSGAGGSLRAIRSAIRASLRSGRALSDAIGDVSACLRALAWSRDGNTKLGLVRFGAGGHEVELLNIGVPIMQIARTGPTRRFEAHTSHVSSEQDYALQTSTVRGDADSLFLLMTEPISRVEVSSRTVEQLAARLGFGQKGALAANASPALLADWVNSGPVCGVDVRTPIVLVALAGSE